MASTVVRTRYTSHILFARVWPLGWQNREREGMTSCKPMTNDNDADLSGRGGVIPRFHQSTMYLCHDRRVCVLLDGFQISRHNPCTESIEESCASANQHT